MRNIEYIIYLVNIYITIQWYSKCAKLRMNAVLMLLKNLSKFVSDGPLMIKLVIWFIHI